MQLYYNPHSRAVTAKWMLDECGIDYELVNIDFSKRADECALHATTAHNDRAL